MGFWALSASHILIAAQATSASLCGVVTDGGNGAPVEGAMVALSDLDQVVRTDATGRYLLWNVPPGPQHVEVRRVGYSPRVFHALVPREGTLEIDVALRPEITTIGPIDVRANVSIRGLEDGGGAAFPDRGLSIAAVRDHPLLSEADVFMATAGGEVVQIQESPSGTHIRGGGSDQVAYLIDGIPVLSPYHAAGSFSAWNPDALSRLDLYSASARPPFPDALSGVVAGTTRSPAGEHRAQGSVSTTQARATFLGPIGGSGAGYLVSLRSTFPGLLFHLSEPSHLRGEGGDQLGKLESPLLGGALRLVGYGSRTEISSTVIEADPVNSSGADPPRNDLAWESRTLGGAWSRRLGSARIDLGAWSAAGDADAAWGVSDSIPPERLSADRRDAGGVAMLGVGGTEGGIRAERIRTRYRSSPSSGAGGELDLSELTLVVAPFVRHERPVTARGALELSLAAPFESGKVYPSPGARLDWKLSAPLALSIACSRRHQFAQSLRNPESIVSNIFPADLYLGAGEEGVPAARSDLALVAIEHRPAAGIRLGAQAYARRMRSLVLIAPSNDSPFATNGFVVGSGSARGLTLEAAANGARYGLVATYGFQRVRSSFADTSFVPEFGATHSLDAGFTYYLVPSSSIRLGASGVFGRHGTAVAGPFEWEACNLLDGGCEFAGSPVGRAGPLGDVDLPPYLRVDLGLRKHWHARVWGRDAFLGAFGSVTNLLGRKNVLTTAIDTTTGARSPIEMRPFSPLVVGIDWRF